MITILLIGDCHVKADDNLMARFDWLGQHIVHSRPDIIIEGGDFADLQSLSHWNSAKKLTLEGQRYAKECESVREAYRKIFEPLKKLQDKQRASKGKIYRPECIKIFGNHEEWLFQYLEEHPQMEGFLDPYANWNLREYFTTFVDFKEYVERGGFQFTHIVSKAGGKFVGGAYAGKHAFDNVSMSTVFFHTHKFTIGNYARQGSGPIMIISGGCYYNHKDEYAKGMPDDVWRGIVELTVFEKGRADIATISLRRMGEMYNVWDD